MSSHKWICGLCGNRYISKQDLTCHEDSTQGNCCQWRVREYISVPNNTEWNEKLDKFHDKKGELDSFEQAEETTFDIVERLLEYEGNRGRYSREPRLAGSFKTDLKLRRADEFDFRIRLKVSDLDLDVDDDDSIKYVMDSDSDDDVSVGKRYLKDYREYTKVKDKRYPPEGYRVVTLDKSDAGKFKDCIIKDTLNPARVLEEFHGDMTDAIEEEEKRMRRRRRRRDDNDVTMKLSRYARGPAVKLSLDADHVPYKISVDLVPYITYEKAWDVYEVRWPRPRTKLWLKEREIEMVLETKTDLVAKRNEFWKVSYGRCEDELLDGVSEVHKMVLRIAKARLKKWRSDHDLDDISSYLLKTQLLWMCELIPWKEYWWEYCLAARFLNFMTEFKRSLDNRYLGAYFNPNENLLENKALRNLDRLSRCVDETINEIGCASQGPIQRPLSAPVQYSSQLGATALPDLVQSTSCVQNSPTPRSVYHQQQEELSPEMPRRRGPNSPFTLNRHHHQQQEELSPEMPRRRGPNSPFTLNRHHHQQQEELSPEMPRRRGPNSPFTLNRHHQQQQEELSPEMPRRRGPNSPFTLNRHHQQQQEELSPEMPRRRGPNSPFTLNRHHQQQQEELSPEMPRRRGPNSPFTLNRHHQQQQEELSPEMPRRRGPNSPFTLNRHHQQQQEELSPEMPRRRGPNSLFTAYRQQQQQQQWHFTFT